MYAYALSMEENIENEKPCNYHEAITSREFIQWIVAMNEENEYFQKNHTWQLIQKPKYQKIVGCKQVFKRNGRIPRVKDARFKACFQKRCTHNRRVWTSMKCFL